MTLRIPSGPELLVGLLAGAWGGCGDDGSSDAEGDSDSEADSGSEETDGETESSESAESGSGSDPDTETGEDSSDSSDSGGGSSGDGGDACEPPPDTCEWEALGSLACDGSECCSSLSCVADRCVDTCGEADDFLAPFEKDFTVFGRICAYQGTRSVVSTDSGCDQTFVYDFSATFAEAEAELSIAVRRAPLSLFEPSLTFSPVYDTTHAWAGVGNPSSPPANIAVNPSQTKLVYWVTDTGDGTSTMNEVDLGTQQVRTLTGVYPGATHWLDDDRVLQCADGIEDGVGLDEEGLWVIDTSGPSLAPTFVAGRFQCGGPLGVVGTTVVLTGGAAVVGGTNPALGVVPISTLEAVLNGEREAVDLYNDPEIQRLARGEVWQHFGTVHGGQWFVAPANAEYTAYQLEVLTVTGDTLDFAAPIPLPMGNFPYADVLHVAADRFVVNTGGVGAVIALK